MFKKFKDRKLTFKHLSTENKTSAKGRKEHFSPFLTLASYYQQKMKMDEKP